MPRNQPATHLHLDPLGGIAGDMVVAALLDAAPELLPEAQALAARIGPGVGIEPVEQRDHGMRGKHLAVTLPETRRGPRHYGEYQALLAELAPDAGVARRAEDILRRLGEAEAMVHGVTLAQVHFHEIADWDSIADVLLAALCLERLGIVSASTSPLPMGGGRVQTEHGQMPVPAPATLLLMQGFPVIDDGVAGERVTPTGAAILAHLRPTPALPATAMQLQRVGHGLGTRRMEGVSNLLRAGLWRAEATPDRDVVGVISFHIDDQTGEDLAVALANLRAREDVLDLLQIPAFGKKGRMMSRIEVICRREAAETVAKACFAETTTIGLRLREERRMLLPRQSDHREIDGRAIGIKTRQLPEGGRLTKAEMDDLAPSGDHAARQSLRRRAERPD